MKTKITYISRDGKEFDTEEECKEHGKIGTPRKILHTTYMHKDKWWILNELLEEWYEFDSESALKHILNEVEVKLEIDTKTGVCKILSFK